MPDPIDSPSSNIDLHSLTTDYNSAAHRTELRSRISALIDIRPGERRLVITSVLTLAGIVGAHIILETARDAFFLVELGASQLTLVYLALAALAGLITRYDSTISRLLGRTNALILSLMSVALGSTLFFLVAKTPTIAFLLYLWVGLSGTVLMLQFWLYTALRFNAAQGRRLYGLITAGGVLGAVLGGVIASLLTTISTTNSLLAVAAALQLVTAFLVTFSPIRSHQLKGKEKKSLKQELSEVFGSPYIRRVMLLTAITTMTLLLIDFLFKTIAAEVIPPAALAPFFARYYTLLNAFALVMQLFIAVRVLQRAGTITALALLPVLVFLGAVSGIFFALPFSAIMLAKGADGALRHSLHKVSTELLYLPLAVKARATAKSLTDSVITRGVQGFTAGALLLLAATGRDSKPLLFSLATLLAFLWFCTAFSLRRPYLQQFRESLGRKSEEPLYTLNQLSIDGVEIVIESLSSPEQARVLSAMTLLEQAHRNRVIPALLLYHPDPQVLLRALQVIPEKERQDWPPLAERLLKHDVAEVRIAALRALGRWGHLAQVEPQSFNDPREKATAAFFRADAENHLDASPAILALTAKNAPTAEREALVDVIADNGTPAWAPVLKELIPESSTRVSRSLCRAMGKTNDLSFIPSLILCLAFPQARDEAERALLKLSQPAFAALKDALLNDSTAPSARRRIPHALALFRNQDAVDFLLATLSRPIPGTIRYKSLRALGTLSRNADLNFSRLPIFNQVEKNAREALRNLVHAHQLELSIKQRPENAQASGELLIEILDNKYGQALERISRLMQLLHPREDLEQVYRALTGKDAAAAAAAPELVEVLTLGYDEHLRALIRLVVDPAKVTSKLKAINHALGVSWDTPEAVLSDLLRETDPAVAALSAEYTEQAAYLQLHQVTEAVRMKNLLLHDLESDQSTRSIWPLIDSARGKA